jgi:hypothetical protein
MFRSFLSLLSLLALAAVAGGCAGAPAQRETATDERDIYRLLIEDQEMGPYGIMLILADSVTTLRRRQISEAVARNPDIGLTPSDLAAIDDLLEAGRVAPPVPLDLGTRRQYEVGDSTTAAEGRDVMFVSGIGWSPARDHAVVHADFFCEGCGWGGLTFFSRGPDGWRIADRRWMWRS